MSTYSSSDPRKAIASSTHVCPYGAPGLVTVVTFDDGLVKWHCSTAMLVANTTGQRNLPKEALTCKTFCPGQERSTLEGA